MKKLRVALPLAAALSLGPSFALTPYQVADIDPRFISDGSQPGRFTAVAGRVVFLAGQGPALWGTGGSPGDPALLLPETLQVRSGPAEAGGRAYLTGCGGGDCGLFVTTGTPAGTIRLVRFPSLSSSSLEAVAPAGLARTLVTVDPGNGTVLWRTDGTPGGSRKVGLAARAPRGLVAFRSKAWFFADLPNARGALFSTDGLNGGTRRMGTSIEGSRLSVVGDRLVYFAGQAVWASDGTPEGTRQLALLPGAGGDVRLPIVVAGGRGYFFNFDTRRELWVTDGTPAGTRRLLAIDGGSNGSLKALGAKVAFIGRDDVRGAELWASDGTTAGTRRVKDVCPGACSGVFQLGVSALGRIWFGGFSPDRGYEVWTSNLTAAGTHQVRDLCAGSCSISPTLWFANGGRVYFVGQLGLDALLYASDGSAAGTLAVGAAASFSAETLDAAPLAGSRIVYSGRDGEHGPEPWISDATPAGTRLLADLQSDNRIGSNPQSFAAAGGRVYFFAADGVVGNELWTSDGTEGGTRLAFDLVPGPDSPRQDFLQASEAGSRLVLFLRQGGFGGFDLVGSDGTPAGSSFLLPDGARADGRRVRAGNRVFFVGIDDAHGAELWSTNGTPGGTIRLTDFVPPEPFRPASSGVPVLLALGDLAVAPVLSPAGGEEVWISDGTAGGTRTVAEIYPFLEAPLALARSPLVELGGRYWFVAANPGDGVASLVRTDLTAAGTAAVGPLDLSRIDSGRWTLRPFAGKMLVFGVANGLGGAFWSSDGTVAGTRVVGPVSLGQGVAPLDFAGRLWFSGDFGELWSTDGTAVGTVRARDAANQTIEANALAVVGNRLAISARGGFYQSDGSAAGTVRIDLPGRPDPFSSQLAFGVGDRLYFSWDDLVHGPELWALRPD